MNKIRAAVVGAGFIGPVHVEALRRLPIEVVGILGSSPEQSKRAGVQLSLPVPWSSYEELLADSLVDVVHITSPNVHHFDMASTALKAGKHVLCEKPLSMTSQESAELVLLAKDYPYLATGVCYNVRYYPLCLQARDVVQSGALGDLVSIRGSYQQDWLLEATDYNWRVLAKEGGELRAVADIGTHWLDLLLSITGLKVEKVLADLRTVHPTRYRPKGEVQTFTKDAVEVETEAISITTEDCGSVLLRLEKGVQGNLWVSQVTPGRKNQIWFEIIGSKKTLHWNSENPEQMWIGSREEASQLIIRDPLVMEAKTAALSTYPAGHVEGFADTFKGLFQSFYEYIALGDFGAPKPFASFEDGHNEVALCEAIRKSHQEECWVIL